jgi:dephospho-CoA kinase
MKSFSRYLEEIWIAPSNGAKYGQIIFLVGGAASGKSTAIKKFIDDSSYKVLNPDDTKALISKAAQQGLGAFKDLKDIDPNTPEGSQELHQYILKTKISSKRAKLVTQQTNRAELPNIIYDRTFSFAGEFKKISQSLVHSGYEANNIHVVFVFTDVEIALKRNRERSRTLPDDVIIKSAKGSKERFTDLFFSREKGAVANGEYHIIIDRGTSSIKVKDAGKRVDRKGEIAKKVGNLLKIS